MTEPLEIEMNGTKPSGGTITIKDGQVTTDTTMTIGDYDVAYNPTNKKYEATKSGDAPLSVVYGKEVIKLTGLSSEEMNAEYKNVL